MEYASLEMEIGNLHDEANRLIEAQPFDVAEAEKLRDKLVACESKAIAVGYITGGARVLRADADKLSEIIAKTSPST